ncbi:hypothetical protein UA08_02316 [Talaromyces atroroseus]|uniref:Gfo/Idh/MocA-like oxidoreductase N-terminal domain-containing protein n=1 Tax=Talaromyces atroroseus TaxID=1441469 RepID=A0A225ALL7_TALAT|nr:hypothetical protein UA08_02316 [Talaromyces atroroseus]OKL61800.1 hypothetical protein UA08_02316 [Talaromyces atroroseus]
MLDSKFSVALVGGGTIAPFHAQHLQSSLVLELIVIIDPFSLGERLAQKLGTSYFKSVSVLLQGLPDRQPDAHIVCVSSSLHTSVTQELLECAAPKEVLVEKPFSTDSKSGSNVVELARQTTHSHREHAAVDKDDLMEEGATIMLQFANGVVGTFIVSDNVASPRGWESATGDNPMFAKAGVPADSYRILRTKGTLSEPDNIL